MTREQRAAGFFREIAAGATRAAINLEEGGPFPEDAEEIMLQMQEAVAGILEILRRPL